MQIIVVLPFFVEDTKNMSGINYKRKYRNFIVNFLFFKENKTLII